jgi:hypothetical protein
MQVWPVRMKESRAINGAQRPLRQHKPPESPPSSSLALGSRPLRHVASDIRQVLSSGSTVQIASKSHAIVFSKAGKTILDPSTRTVHSPPELN